MDVLTPEQRRRCMAAVRSKHTKPELLVRRLVHSLGYRYRLHRRDLPGCPDLAFPRRRKVIFVHGCFWHRHSCHKGRSLPATRRRFWEHKLADNKKRDGKIRRRLNSLGWRRLVIWECQTVPSRHQWLAERILRFLESE